MNKCTKSFLSAVVSAALCISGIPLQKANADIIIDHNCSGIDKGYYFEMVNNDKDSQPDLALEPGGCFNCRWDNEEDFSASRGLKFDYPVMYTSLGDFSYKYWKRIDTKGYTDKEKGYVRLGIRLHNTQGDVIDILEIDDSADGRSIIEKDGKYSKIGSVDSEETFNDTEFGVRVKGESKGVSYTIYSKDNDDNNGRTVICRRNEPLSINNDTEDQRRISISDKLEAISDAGIYIGELTDVGIFLESAYSKGEAIVYTYDIDIEANPAIAPDQYEDEDDTLTVTNYDYGVRTGYYYGVNSRYDNSHMEVIPNALFKAEWDARENKYNNDPTFERGKQYDQYQSYKAVAGSSIEYTMDFDVEGSFAVSTLAKLDAIELPKYYVYTEMYIVDACSKGWKPSEYVENIGEFSAEGVDYDVYDASYSLIGTGKGQVKQRYYFVRKDAEENGSAGTVNVMHDLKSYMNYVHDLGVVLGRPDVLVAQVNGGVSKGSAELKMLYVSLPFGIADDGEYEKETRRVDLGGINRSVYVNGLKYDISSDTMTMKGYAGEKINYAWEQYQAPAYSSYDIERSRSFRIGMTNICRDDDSIGCNIDEGLRVDYNIDMGDIASVKKDPKWVLGGFVECLNPKGLSGEAGSDEYYGCDILIADKWDGELTSEFVYGAFRDPEELGVIESKGVKYDVIAYYPEVAKDNLSFVIVKRQKQLEAVDAEDVPDGFTRYAGSFDAADIIRKLGGLGVETYEIYDVYFSLDVLRNEGAAVVNSVSAKRVKNLIPAYTDDDISKLSDFLLGKKADIKAGTDYDVNGDGKWDIYDLGLMRKLIAEGKATGYIEPDEKTGFGYPMYVYDELKLYAGPDESYECVATVPKNTELYEYGYDLDNNDWVFTEYKGSYGWAKITDSLHFSDQFGKPVIYLYPEQETDVHVELELTGTELATTYPKYNNGWDVTAYPDGSLLNKADGTHHKYLFWDSVNASTVFDFSKGFCVAGCDTESFLKEKLTYMGLSEEEMNEFIVYWLPKMEYNEYNLISFQGDIYTNAAKLDITPKPDSMLRIFMTYIPLEDAVDIEPQQLETFERKGFTVVEWGGSEVNAKVS